MPLRHHTLVAKQRADDLLIELHKLSRSAFPRHELCELASQTRRSAFSVAVNIVEGCARDHEKEKLQFLNTAHASLAEVGYCLHVARPLEYINDKQFEKFDLRIRQTSAALNGYIRSIGTGVTPSKSA